MHNITVQYVLIWPSGNIKINVVYLYSFNYYDKYFFAETAKMPLKPHQTFRIFVLTAVLAVLLGINFPLSPVYASINEAFTYQGKLVNDDGTNLTNSDASCVLAGSADICDIRISIYDDPSAGTLRWQETKSDVEIYDNDGIFNLVLDCGGTFSSCNQNGGPDFSSDTLYIEVEFDPDGDGDFVEGETFSPRRELTSVPYSFNSKNADQIDGIDSTSFLRSDTNASLDIGNTLTIDGILDVNGGLIVSDAVIDFDGTQTVFSFAGDFSLDYDNLFLEKSTGKIGIGTSSPEAFLDIAAATSATPSITIQTGSQPSAGSAGDIYSNGTNLYFYDGTASAWVNATSNTLQEAYNEGNTVDIISGNGAFSLDLQSANVDIEVGEGTDTGDFRIWNGADTWFFIDEDANTLDLGALASGGLTIDAGTGTVNLGTSSNSKTINIGIGDSANTINIGTDDTTGDTISIGNTNIATTVSIYSGNTWSISESGAVAGVTTLESSGDWTWSATTPTITSNSGETFTLTDGNDSFVINTTGSYFSLSDGSNSFTFDVDSGPSYAGNARPSKTIVLIPEYNGAVLTSFYGAGTDTDTNGIMTSDSETTPASSIKNYYQWERTSSGQHFYTVAIRCTLPPDFSGWETSNALVVNYITESATSTNSDVDVRVYLEGDGTADASDTDNTSLTWDTVSFGSSDLNLWNTAGEVGVIYLRLGSAAGNFARVGDIELNYHANY